MDVFLDFIYLLVSVVLSLIIFTILFNGLNQSILQLFVPLQRIVKDIKQKELVRNICFTISIALCVIIKNYFNLNYIEFGALIGFFNSIVEISFRK